MSKINYLVDDEKLDNASINLSQASATLSLLATSGESNDSFGISHRDSLQVIYGCRQMIDEAYQMLLEGTRSVPAEPALHDTPTSGM